MENIHLFHVGNKPVGCMYVHKAIATGYLTDGARNMRITFENNTQVNTEKVTTSYSHTRTKESGKTGVFAADISGTVMDNNAYGVHGRTAEEVMQEAQLTDVATQRNYMSVMSNSMSTEDFSRMLEEGANPNDMEIDTVVTIIDRMKAELVKAGVHVAGYTDELDSETLAQIVGSEAFANQLQDAFLQNDIPVTEENVTAAMDAIREASGLTELTDGEMKYLVSNGMEPTVENLYMAEHAGAVDADRQGHGYYQENYGYYAKKADSIDFDKLLPQVEKILTDAGIEVTEDAIEQARWILEKGIPLTAENIACYRENDSVQLPVDEKAAAKAIVSAMAEGRRPDQANLAEGKSKYQKAAELSERVERWLQDDTLSLSARRRLEEARLRMSAEVNVRLIESGFSIDTSDMEALVEALKEAEARQAQRMFPEQDEREALDDYRLYRETLATTALLPDLPAATIGKLIFEEKLSVSVEHLASSGTKLKEDYQRAGESYEALMTAPRRDLGDSIRKAFANVDDILTDLGMELSAENQRAVRILSYNQLPITPQNLDQVRAADRKVQRVVDRMTPSSTLQMIRDGINPLTTDMSELEQYFKDQSDQPESEMETYSRYLYQLEKNHEITAEERDAYIGVYRMLRQIEKSDGAVIGSVLKAQGDLNFKQLLTAARTAKRAGMDIMIDESFGGLTELKAEGSMIDEQIGRIDELDKIRSLKNVEDEVIQSLQQLDLPITINNLLAASALAENANPLFKYMKEQLSGDSGKTKDTIQSEVSLEESEASEERLFETLSDTLTGALTGREEMQEAYQQFGSRMIEYLKENLYQPGQTSMDIKAMKSASLQMSIAMKRSQEETYEIPAVFSDGVAAIRLTIRHQSEANGQASISMETEGAGKINAFLQVRQTEVTGYVAAGESTAQRLQGIEDALREGFKKQGMTLQDFRVVPEESRPISPKVEENQEKTAARTVYEAAKLVIHALQQSL